MSISGEIRKNAAASEAKPVQSLAYLEDDGRLPEYTNYEKVIADLFRWKERQAKYIPSVDGCFSKSSLLNMRVIASYLGNPQDSFKIVHVAGTNGKGSVCLKTAASLQAVGLRTGLFTSPHISCFRERIQVDGRMIEEGDVVALFNRVT